MTEFKRPAATEPTEDLVLAAGALRDESNSPKQVAFKEHAHSRRQRPQHKSLSTGFYWNGASFGLEKWHHHWLQLA